jgi:hypothetical protein
MRAILIGALATGFVSVIVWWLTVGMKEEKTPLQAPVQQATVNDAARSVQQGPGGVYVENLRIEAPVPAAPIAAPAQSASAAQVAPRPLPKETKATSVDSTSPLSRPAVQEEASPPQTPALVVPPVRPVADTTPTAHQTPVSQAADLMNADSLNNALLQTSDIPDFQRRDASVIVIGCQALSRGFVAVAESAADRLSSARHREKDLFRRAAQSITSPHRPAPNWRAVCN